MSAVSQTPQTKQTIPQRRIIEAGHRDRIELTSQEATKSDLVKTGVPTVQDGGREFNSDLYLFYH